MRRIRSVPFLVLAGFWAIACGNSSPSTENAGNDEPAQRGSGGDGTVPVGSGGRSDTEPRENASGGMGGTLANGGAMNVGGLGGERGDCAVAEIWFADADGDGRGDPNLSVEACAPPEGYVTTSDDCDDAEASAAPGLTEVCDGHDNDCDGTTDFGLSVPATHATIAAAINAATTGQHICIAEGSYDEGALIINKDLIIEGQSRNGTLIQGITHNPLNRFTVSSGASVEFRSLTLEQGRRALWITGAEVQLEDIRIRDNVSPGSGAAMWVGNGSEITLKRVTVENNSVSNGTVSGGALRFVDSDTVWDEVVLTGTDMAVSELCSGSVFLSGGTHNMSNVVIAGNGCTASDGEAAIGAAGINSSAATVHVTNTSIVGNHCDPGTGTTGGCGWRDFGGTVSMNNTDVSQNTANGGSGGVHRTGSYDWTVSYSNVWGNSSSDWRFDSPVGADGNLSLDPEYTNISSGAPETWDFRLGNSSSLKDAGDPSLFDRDASRSDIGYEGGARVYSGQ